MTRSREAFDHVLFVGFGGPERPDEVRPFIERVVAGMRVPEARLRQVERHYALVGGRSPYHDAAVALVERVTQVLQSHGVTIPVALGMRQWRPFLTDVIAGLARRGLQRGLAVVLAPHRSEASFDRYVVAVEEVVRACNQPIRYEYLGGWHDHPLFIRAQADTVREAAAGADVAHLLFTAHAIPVAQASRAPYEPEVRRSSELVAQALGRQEWSVAYQSRSGPPHEPWLEPEVAGALQQLAALGVRHVVVVPIGFWCDNVEVLYDLDMEARREAERLGMRYVRAATVASHPAFHQLFADTLIEQLRARGSVRPLDMSRHG